MLKHIDSAGWTRRCKISDEHWDEILELLIESSEKDVDDCAVLSFIYWKGIKVQQNIDLAE